ncbi:MAG TPA: hypothetical protein DHV62_09035 [Elusimicrobia bacterium]|jgi:hypothetical protein|nr:hypothetical protein [Elusimicrobiota bacterium]
MKCPKCGQENKESAKYCSKCGTSLTVLPFWMPTWKWHLRALGIIYIILVVLFFLLRILLKSYVRPIIENW